MALGHCPSGVFGYDPPQSTRTLLWIPHLVQREPTRIKKELVCGFESAIMIRWFRTALGAKLLRTGNLGLLLELAILVGCQGVSSNTPANQQQQSGSLLLGGSSLNFGSVTVGTSETASASLSAGGANVRVTAASTNNSRFTIGGLSLPIIIPAGQIASFTVTFSPQIAGADSAILTFTSNAQPSTTMGTVTGTGAPAPTHTVSLSWNASTSPNISGYNIYRAIYANSCGSYSKINGAILDVATEYTDFSVTDGTNYCYATTAVNSSNEESGYSNIVSDVQIPPP